MPTAQPQLSANSLGQTVSCSQGAWRTSSLKTRRGLGHVRETMKKRTSGRGRGAKSQILRKARRPWWVRKAERVCMWCSVIKACRLWVVVRRRQLRITRRMKEGCSMMTMTRTLHSRRKARLSGRASRMHTMTRSLRSWGRITSHWRVK